MPQIGIPELLVLALIFLLPVVIVLVGTRWLLPRLARRSMKWWQKTQMEVQRELEEEQDLKSNRQ